VEFSNDIYEGGRMMDGKLFRQLRKDRGLRLQDVADEVNSVSFISKF
jgi:transcriptional regulator with XRE-family HTH domain